MSDLIYLALVLAFFALCAGLVRACEWIIGPDEPASGRGADTTADIATETTGVSA